MCLLVKDILPVSMMLIFLLFEELASTIFGILLMTGQHVVIEILKHIRTAMTKESVLIIHDWVLSEDDISRFQALQDMNMMCLGGGMERTEQQHRGYITQAGLKVIRIFRPYDSISESIIEAVVACA